MVITNLKTPQDGELSLRCVTNEIRCVTIQNSVLLEDWICVFSQADLPQTSERQFIYIKTAGKGPLTPKCESAFMFHF